jgi:hypothetical protein
MSHIAPGSKIRLADEVIVPMTTFNIFACIGYLPHFFGVWTLDIVSTLVNMAYKVIDYNGITMDTCLHANLEPAFQFYNINNKAYFSSLANADPFGPWIQFQTGNYQRRYSEFYSSS